MAEGAGEAGGVRLLARLHLVVDDVGLVPLHREADRLHRALAVAQDRLHDVGAEVVALVLDVGAREEERELLLLRLPLLLPSHLPDRSRGARAPPPSPSPALGRSAPSPDWRASRRRPPARRSRGWPTRRRPTSRARRRRSARSPRRRRRSRGARRRGACTRGTSRPPAACPRRRRGRAAPSAARAAASRRPGSRGHPPPPAPPPRPPPPPAADQSPGAPPRRGWRACPRWRRAVRSPRRRRRCP